ncbi:MAG: response regulator [Bacteroidia bacterium]
MQPLKHIILVEDDTFDAEMTIRALGQIPIANPIVHLETGQDLLDYLDKEGVGHIAVVLLDLNTPKLSGLEALREIRQRAYDYFPIVVLTSSGEGPDIRASYALGVNSFVSKPVRNLDFQEAIRTLGLYWGLMNELPPT